LTGWTKLVTSYDHKDAISTSKEGSGKKRITYCPLSTRKKDYDPSAFRPGTAIVGTAHEKKSAEVSFRKDVYGQSQRTKRRTRVLIALIRRKKKEGEVMAQDTQSHVDQCPFRRLQPREKRKGRDKSAPSGRSPLLRQLGGGGGSFPKRACG